MAANGVHSMNRLNLKTFPCVHYIFVLGLSSIALLASGNFAVSQPAPSNDSSSGPVFRLDGGNTTYAFGVNERGELQQIYWGGAVAGSDAIPAAKSKSEWASFDSPYNNTPQEYAGWGAGLFLEPALKVTFADGNRDLVLRYAGSSQPDAHSLEV